MGKRKGFVCLRAHFQHRNILIFCTLLQLHASARSDSVVSFPTTLLDSRNSILLAVQAGCGPTQVLSFSFRCCLGGKRGAKEVRERQGDATRARCGAADWGRGGARIVSHAQKKNTHSRAETVSFCSSILCGCCCCESGTWPWPTATAAAATTTNSRVSYWPHLLRKCEKFFLFPCPSRKEK